MIDVKIVDNEKIYGIYIKGHAGYAEKGKDIVCAAVSSLYNSALEYLAKRMVLTDYGIDSGNSFIVVKKEGIDLKSIGCIEATFDSLRMMSKVYPLNVHFSLVEK